MLNDNAPFNPEDFGFRLVMGSFWLKVRKGDFALFFLEKMPSGQLKLEVGTTLLELGDWPSSNREFRIRNEGVVELEIYG